MKVNNFFRKISVFFTEVQVFSESLDMYMGGGMGIS